MSSIVRIIGSFARRVAAVASVAAAIAALGPALPALAQGLPSYRVHYLGSGSPSGIGGTGGVVIGVRLVGSSYVPLVSVGGASWTELPVPSGAMSVLPTDVNGEGVVVGVSFSPQFNATAVRWRPGAGGYTVEELPRLPGDASSYATAINDLGQIVGARRALGYVPAASSGWLYSDALGVVDLLATYGWAVSPVDINDAGQMIAGVERLDLETGILDVIGDSGPANYNLVSGIEINDAGMVAGLTSLRSTSLNILSVFRYEGDGWRYIAGTSRYTTVSSINARGDIGYGEQGAGVHLDGLGTHPVWSLLDPAEVAAGWVVTGNGALIDDRRAIATTGRNTQTGQAGAVLLVPIESCGDGVLADSEACDDGNGASGDGCSPACAIEECSDGVANDGDGLTDHPADPGCESPSDLSERAPALVCDDGADADADGRADYDTDPALGDPGCRNASWPTEDPACQDGIDNDHAAGIDFDGGASRNGGVAIAPADPDCAGDASRQSEAAACGYGAELALLMPLLAVARARSRGRRRAS